MNQESVISYNRKNISNQEIDLLYRAVTLPRMIEEKMLVLLRQGKISKWFSGIGQEAIAVGATLALAEDEYVLPLHRNLGVFTARNLPLNRLFAQLQGKASGFSHGRERSFHFGTNEHHIFGMISHLGPQLSVGAGIALAHKLREEKKVSLAFTGEGGTSEGEFHEALNVAAVWDLPVIFLIENNGYGLSTPVAEQYRCAQLADRGIGYGIESKTIDGNNILEVYQQVKSIAEDLRNNPRPYLLECMTFRMRGHEEASGTKYVPKELQEIWAAKDPVTNFESWLLKEGLVTEKSISELKSGYKKQIEQALNEAFDEPPPVVDHEKEKKSVYFPFEQKLSSTNSTETTAMRFVDAISDGLREAMVKHPELVLMGQDIAEYGGVFKITDGFLTEFGRDRVRNTPICESAILGIGMGLSVKGIKSMVEMQFADFASCGFNQIVNNLAKIHYRWGQPADIVVRMPTGAGVGAGPFHSQSNEAWYFHTPGLKILYPSSPADAKGLLLAAFEDPNPILFFEHKALYRSLIGEVPKGYYTTEIGKAKLVAEGQDLSIITYGAGVQWALQTIEKNPFISADILDLRTLLPFDKEAIVQSVEKTGKAIILHEDTLTGGIGAEISAIINEHCFDALDGPVMRCAALDTPVPFALSLEEGFLPKNRFESRLLELYNY